MTAADGGTGRRRGRVSPSFWIHAFLALAGIATLNVLIATYAPFSIRKIGPSYLIFYYHFPAAMSCLTFFTINLVASIAVLRTGSAAWDRRARAAGEVGLLTTTITLATGSTWAKAAWGHWWDWSDARLMSAAIMWLTYAGYVLLQNQVDGAAKRRRFAAVFGVIAYLNIPFVHYAVEWFGKTSHPMKFEDLSSDPRITTTRWVGVLVFFVFYLLLYRWRLAREATKERLETVLARVRRLEERAEGASS